MEPLLQNLSNRAIRSIPTAEKSKELRNYRTDINCRAHWSEWTTETSNGMSATRTAIITTAARQELGDTIQIRTDNGKATMGYSA